jgi:DNA gyrase/topoisomerase IV subunit B
LLDAGKIVLIHPPMIQITATGLQEMICALTDEEAAIQISRLTSSGMTDVAKKHFRGLGSMGNAVLSKYCVNPATRVAIKMRASDAVAAIEAFSPNGRKPLG